MRPIAANDLAPNVRSALDELAAEVRARYPVTDLVLYGSYARGTWDEASDVDLLLLTSRPLSRAERHGITDLAFDANLRNGTNFSTLVVDKESWERGRFRSLPIRLEIQREGIAL